MSSTPEDTGSIKVPVAGKRNILITSALPYVNNVPHLGNIVGCVLSADVYARFCKQRGYNALFICGTDEYGTATETKAQQEGTTPRALCDKYHPQHKAIYEWFDVQFDYFGRTTTDAQTQIAQDFFHACDANGYIETGSVEQLYCATCDRALADRFVRGVCPHPGCGYEDAKGDQCDKCSRLCNATELGNPQCTTCGGAPEKKESQHLFLSLQKLEAKLKAFAAEREAAGVWSANTIAVTQQWLKAGLKPRCITRDLKWGTPVPKEGFEGKVFYVWFDAPIGYVSITANYCKHGTNTRAQSTPEGDISSAKGTGEEWKQWWCPAEGAAGAGAPGVAGGVELAQFLGKDNIPFHTIMFPATLLAANGDANTSTSTSTGGSYITPHSIPATEYLNYEGAKFSKSRGVGVFGDQAAATGIPSEVWRYYLIASRPENADTMFAWDDFREKVNADLADTLGNLVQRTLKFVHARFGGVIPAYVDTETTGPSRPLSAHEATLEASVQEHLAAYVTAMEQQRIREALRSALSVAAAANKFMSEAKPWDMAKTDLAACGNALRLLVQVIYLLTAVCEPFMPAFAAKALKMLAMPAAKEHFAETRLASSAEGKWWSLRAALAGADGALSVPAGHAIPPPPDKALGEKMIFEPITATQLDALRKQFAGHVEPAAEGTPFPCALAVGTVVSAAPHPKNPKALVLAVDCGAGKDKDTGAPLLRPIVSAIADVYAAEGEDAATAAGKLTLVGTQVVVLTNIKGGNFGGVRSEGMLLTGVSLDADGNSTIRLLSPAAAVKNGAAVLPAGYKPEPAKVFDVKGKLAGLGLAINKDSAATANGGVFLCGDVPVLAVGVAEGGRVC